MGHLYGFPRRTHRRLTAEAAIRSAVLSALFLAVYGGCNWIASRRADVGTWAFAWERHIPFWPAMIAPYLSIDALFVAAPFLCRDREELLVFTRRVASAVVAAGVCFLLVPLRFAFERPVADGWLGALFQQFTALDRPFNLFPSLHVTLTVILADVYRRRTRGILRSAVTAWFVLIGLSTLFTWQHHVVDVAGGLALATVVFHFVRAGRMRTGEASNPRVALYYLSGSAALGAGALAFWPWGGLLLWPALSVAIVGAAYFGAGPWIFAKSNGRLPLTTWLLLWPCLIGQRVSLAWYRRQCRPYDAVTPHVWIGRQLSDREAADAVAAGVVAVVDLTPDFTEAPAFRRLPYLNVPTLDLTAPDPASLRQAVQFVSAHEPRGIVYVHCKIGYSRSAAVVAAFLLSTGHARSLDEALAMIRGARPQVVIRPEIVACLNPRGRDEAVGVPSTTPVLARVRLRLSQGPARPPGASRAESGPALPRAIASFVLAAAARLFCGSPTWAAQPDGRPRVYYANHTSHLDFVVLWGSLPRDVRMRTRPVAGRDYWEKTPLRSCLAHHFLDALLVDRARPGTNRGSTVRLAGRSIERAARALDSGASLIVFPEGTRGNGDDLQPFKSGLYHLARARPDIEFVPVFLENIHRILPKGETIPVPLSGAVTSGTPVRIRTGETKAAFLARARHALLVVNRPCIPPSTATSRPSLQVSSSS